MTTRTYRTVSEKDKSVATKQHDAVAALNNVRVWGGGAAAATFKRVHRQNQTTKYANDAEDDVNGAPRGNSVFSAVLDIILLKLL